MTAPDDRSAEGRGGLNPPHQAAPDDRSAEGRGGSPPLRAAEERGAQGFLSRWSRLKRGEMAEPTAEPPAPPAPPPAEEAEPFDLSLLPRIEDLTAESDISLFLRKGVPPALRQAALRRIWTLDPAIRDFIGPAEYAWDFNAPGGVPGIAEPLTGEVAALLAHAIGAAPPPEAAAPPRASAEPPAAATEEDPPAPAQQELPSPASEPFPPEADTAPPRRRHGGALPV